MFEVLDRQRSSHGLEDLRSKLGSADPSLIGDVLQLRLGKSRMWRLVEQSLRVQARPPLFERLGEIPFAGVITPIWASAFDDAFSRPGRIVIGPTTTHLSAVLRAQRFFLLKVYGDLSASERLFSNFTEQYREVVSRNPEYQRFVSSAVANGTLLFLGTTPEEIRDFLAAVDMGSRPERPHFALVPNRLGTELERERMVGLYNVTLLTHDDRRRRDSVSEIERFARRLSLRLGRRQLADSTPGLRPEVLHEITLENIGPYTDLRIRINDDWNVLLGDNACGKSTILRAVALALCGDDSRAEPAAASLLRVNAREGTIVLRAGKSVFRTKLLRDENRVRVSPSVITPVQGGSWLALGFPPLRGVSYSRPGGSSDEASPTPVLEDLLPLVNSTVDSRLDDLGQWIVNMAVRAQNDKAEAVEPSRSAQLLDSFFRIVQRLTPGLHFTFAGIDPNTWETLVRTDDGVIPIQRLSQGMSSLLNWAGVLLQRLYEVYGDSAHPETERALVLLDEVDAHLHPSWQRKVIPLVREAFPNLQVIATTHSPFIVANLRDDDQCWYLKREDSETGVTAGLVPAAIFRGRRVDQVLTGPGFDMASTRDQWTSDLMEEYRNLFAKEDLTKGERSRLNVVSAQLEHVVPTHQETEEARQAGAVVGEYLDQRLADLPADKKKRIEEEAKVYLASLKAGKTDVTR